MRVRKSTHRRLDGLTIPCPHVGKVARNDGKGRPVVVVPCGSEDLETAFTRIAAQPGVQGSVASSFTNGRYAMVFKRRTVAFKGCLCLSVDRRLTDEAVQRSLEAYHAVNFVSNVELLRVKVAEEGKMPTFEEAVEMLDGVSMGEFNASMGNAKRAATYKKASPLQQAMLTYPKELEKELQARAEAEAMLMNVSEKDFELCAEDFDLERALGLKGVHCEMDAQGRYRIHEVTWRQAISEPLGPRRPPLYLIKGLCLVGGAGCQKGGWSRANAREFCKRRGKTKYGYGASFCPYGMLTKQGKMSQIGAIVLYDFDLTTRGGQHHFTAEERKSFTYLEEPTHIKAFYNEAVLEVHVPRILSMNSGKNDNGEPDPGWWFRCNQVPGLEILMSAFAGEEALRKAEDEINKGDENTKAQARRAVLFFVDSPLKRAGADTAAPQIGNDLWEADQVNMTQLPEI